MQISASSKRMTGGLLILMTAQFFCAVFFVADALFDFRQDAGEDDTRLHLVIETLAALGLISAVILEAKLLMSLLRRQAQLEASIDVARAAVQDVMNALFETWRLTPSETDIATFLVKGLSIAEIAELRGNAEGTIKSHLGAIYRKSGTRNRGELLSVLIDSMMARDSDATPDAWEGGVISAGEQSG